jgi:hypothetical protein
MWRSNGLVDTDIMVGHQVETYVQVVHRRNLLLGGV